MGGLTGAEVLVLFELELRTIDSARVKIRGMAYVAKVGREAAEEMDDDVHQQLRMFAEVYCRAYYPSKHGQKQAERQQLHHAVDWPTHP